VSNGRTFVGARVKCAVVDATSCALSATSPNPISFIASAVSRLPKGIGNTTMTDINPIATAVHDRLSADARWLSRALAKRPAME
jgi:hypothetical protein